MTQFFGTEPRRAQNLDNFLKDLKKAAADVRQEAAGTQPSVGDGGLLAEGQLLQPGTSNQVACMIGMEYLRVRLEPLHDVNHSLVFMLTSVKKLLEQIDLGAVTKAVESGNKFTLASTSPKPGHDVVWKQHWKVPGIGKKHFNKMFPHFF